MSLSAKMLDQTQFDLVLDRDPVFPSTRYQGSKAKIVEWIVEQIRPTEYSTCLDAFGGTGVVAHALKSCGLEVTYNDLMRANLEVGRALIENSGTTLSPRAVDTLLDSASCSEPGGFIHRTFPEIYFTDDENCWLDHMAQTIVSIEDQYERAIAYFALFQSCIAKRPYNLFHRKNLYMRFADVERSFGNKATWDTPFPVLFRKYAAEANDAVFDNGRQNRAVCGDALGVTGDFDLVYVDTPYISASGSTVDYSDFYHFLNGLTCYDEWPARVDAKSKHRRMKREPNVWNDKSRIREAFDSLFERYEASALAVSYRSDGIPDIDELVRTLSRYKRDVTVETYGQYKYVLSKNGRSHEVLIVAR